MNLLPFFRRRPTLDLQLATLVRTLSDACQTEVWNRVRDQVFDMDVAEARGYIRARAMAPVRHRIPAVVSGVAVLSTAQQARLTTHATDRVVQRILCEMAAGSSVGRRAA